MKNYILIFFFILLSSSNLFASIEIEKVEYYIDTDPGFGKGTNVTFVKPINDILLDFNVDLKSINHGYHTLYIRAKDSKDVWSLCYSTPFFKTKSTTIDIFPQLTKTEYFVDNDPGFGNGTSIKTDYTSTNQSIDYNIDIKSLKDGLHFLYIRSLDAYGKWSFKYIRPFYKAKTTPIDNPPFIVKAEYYIDVDPGFGKASNVLLENESNDMLINLLANINEIDSGFHMLYIRTMDSNGKWSSDLCRPFYKVDSSLDIPSNITKAEYYFDEDPGFGKGKNILIENISDNLLIDFNADIDNIDIGFHILYIRALDTNAKWSFNYNRQFYKTDISYFDAQPEIVKAEYYLDTDPGFGKGNVISITGKAHVNKQFIVNLKDINNGLHVLYFRVKDKLGNWCITHSHPFFKTNQSLIDEVPSIVQLEYCFDNNCDVGQGVNISITSGNTLETNFFVKVNDLGLGDHTLFVRVKDVNGAWSNLNTIEFVSTPMSLMDAILILHCLADIKFPNGLEFAYEELQNIISDGSLDMKDAIKAIRFLSKNN